MSLNNIIDKSKYNGEDEVMENTDHFHNVDENNKKQNIIVHYNNSLSTKAQQQ